MIAAFVALTGCASSTPSDSTARELIAGQLARDTAGQLFDVESVVINSGKLRDDGVYVVEAAYNLRFKSTINDYLKFMLKETSVNQNVDASALKDELRNRLVSRFGNPRVGQVSSFTARFYMRRETFGWQVFEP